MSTPTCPHSGHRATLNCSLLASNSINAGNNTGWRFVQWAVLLAAVIRSSVLFVCLFFSIARQPEVWRELVSIRSRTASGERFRPAA
jgi:hypothetical protein